MIDGYINIARKLSKEFDIVLAKDLYSSFVIKRFEIHLTISLGGELLKVIPSLINNHHMLNNKITHLFKERILRFYLYIC